MATMFVYASVKFFFKAFIGRYQWRAISIFRPYFWFDDIWSGYYKSDSETYMQIHEKYIQ